MARAVQNAPPHTHIPRGDAVMAKELKFPSDVEDFIHELCANAILRAVENGTYVQREDEQNAQEG